MYSLNMITSNQKFVFFECVSKGHVIHSSKNYPNVRLSKSLFKYKIYTALRNWHTNIKLTVIEWACVCEFFRLTFQTPSLKRI